MKDNTRLYRIRNWPQYITALINRESLSVWLDTSSIDRWLNHQPSVHRVRPLVYADAAIESALLIGEAYHLPLRQTQGLIHSLFLLLKIDLPVPHYCTLCRRARMLRINLSPPLSHQPLHLLVDSSGFKVYGEGECYRRLRKLWKRRTWRKLHISVDHQSGLIVSATASHKDLLDRNALPHLLSQVDPPVAALYGDGPMTSGCAMRRFIPAGQNPSSLPSNEQYRTKMLACSHESEHKTDEETWPCEVEEEGRLPPPLACRDGILPLEADLFRTSQIKKDRLTRRGDDNQV